MNKFKIGDKLIYNSSTPFYRMSKIATIIDIDHEHNNAKIWFPNEGAYYHTMKTLINCYRLATKIEIVLYE